MPELMIGKEYFAAWQLVTLDDILSDGTVRVCNRFDESFLLFAGELRETMKPKVKP